MSKGFRVLLHILQLLSLLGALWYLSFSFRNAYFDFGLSDGEIQHLNTWIIGLTVLSIALSPSLWSLSRAGSQAAAPASIGSYDRVPPAPVPAQQQPGNAFEPMNASQAPAPPASSYGQPSAGGITPASSPQAGSPWNPGR
ncbi:hypothetical protein AB0K52_23000 [Glycomyces sp. NPDC049804]|uniref:hypothetical protein n=1 Tax=Glycomyces sp. NPDC049804 TaxID=3154363 RepID=UPI0034210ACB